MTKADATSPTLGTGPGEPVSTRSPCYKDTRRLLDTLNFYLPSYEARLGVTTYTLICDNLRVLTDCFDNEPLPTGVVEIIHEHLLTLSRMLAFKLN